MFWAKKKMEWEQKDDPPFDSVNIRKIIKLKVIDSWKLS